MVSEARQSVRILDPSSHMTGGTQGFIQDIYCGIAVSI